MYQPIYPTLDNDINKRFTFCHLSWIVNTFAIKCNPGCYFVWQSKVVVQKKMHFI